MSAMIFRIFCLLSIVSTALGAEIQPKSPIDSLPLGKNRYKLVTSVHFSSVSWKNPNDVLWGDYLTYTPSSQDDLLAFIKRRLDSEVQSENPGSSWLDIDVGIAFCTFEEFHYVETPQGWKLPRLDIEFIYGGQDFDLPGITALEVESEDGKIFSTIINKDDFEDQLCGLASVRSAFREGILRLPSLVFGSNIRKLTAHQNERFVTFQGDGIATAWSSTPPSFFKPKAEPTPAKPLTVHIRNVEGVLTVCVTGDGAERAQVLQSRNLRVWDENPYSISQPAKKAANGEYQFSIVDTDGAWFYKARTSSESQQR